VGFSPSDGLVIVLPHMQYYEEIGKPTPKVEVMQYLKAKQYVDAKDFAGECEAVVVVAKGQGIHVMLMPCPTDPPVSFACYLH
jgi:hypothetical protein